MAIERVDLTLRLGELVLGDLHLRLSVDRTHFLARRRPPVPPPAALEGDGHLIRSCPVDEALPLLSFSGGYLRYVPAQYPRYYIDLSLGWEAYQKKFSGRSRQTLRRKLRRFAQASGGEIDWRTYASPDEIGEFHTLARRVSERTYQERLMDAGLPDGDEFRARAQALAGRDAVRGYLLFREGRPVAYLYCPVQDGAVLYRYLGYDPSAAHLSPGTVLQWLVLEALFAEGRFRIFDFTSGEGAHKSYFASGHANCADIFFLKPTAKPVAAALSHALMNGVSESAAWIAGKLGMKARIKRLLRYG